METKLEQLKAACQSMEEGRESFESHWQDIADYVCPRAYRWLDKDDYTTRGNKANKRIIDPQATLAIRAMVSAFSSSITSPARPWKKLSVSSPQFRDNFSVKTWLAVCDEILDSVVLKSNFYQEASKVYEQAGLFGTAAMLIEEDFDDTIRCETLPAGSYYLGTDAKRRVNQFHRRFKLTAAQMVGMFGEDAVSDRVREAYGDKRRRNAQSSATEVWHWVGPNDEFEPGAVGEAGKRFLSVYFDPSDCYGGEEKVLRQAGYDEFPVIAPRWKVYGDDIYGQDCPAMVALGHIKALQHIQKQINKAAEKQVNPPLQAPESARRLTIETIAGSVNNVDSRSTGDGIRPLYQVNFDINSSVMLVDNLRKQINEAFFYNLFLMVANERRSGTKAREIDELHEEKMIMLSNVYEQFSQEFLNPAVSRIFAIANRRGLFPEPPPEFQGQDFSIEYISVMAQAMKMVGIGAMDRAFAIVGQVASINPTAVDVLNVDRFTSMYLDRLGADPRTMNTPDEIAQIRQARAQAQAQQQQMQASQMQADTLKTMSEAKIAPDNALAALVNQAKGL